MTGVPEKGARRAHVYPVVLHGTQSLEHGIGHDLVIDLDSTGRNSLVNNNVSAEYFLSFLFGQLIIKKLFVEILHFLFQV